MDVAIVTGADSRFGDSVIRTLLQMGFRVHALGQNPDPASYDPRYVVARSYGPGKLAELKGALDEILAEEGRLDLLVGIGGPEVTAGWEESAPEALVRRLHGCLTEPLLAANVCLPALKASKGFLIHGHRRPVSRDLAVSPGYFEDSLRQAYDDLFIRNAETGLRSARVLYAHPESEPEHSPIHQDIADSVSRAFEIILRQKETCVVREIHISPRGLVPASRFPNLVPGMDPYQTTVLPEGDPEEQEPILIPTEKPRHYVQIAEVKDITRGEEDPEADAAWEEDEDEGEEDPSSEDTRRQRPARKRSRGGRRKPKGEGPKREDGDQSSPEPKETPAAEGTTEEPPPKKRPARKRSRSRKPARKPAASADGESPESDSGPPEEPSAKPPPESEQGP